MLFNIGNNARFVMYNPIMNVRNNGGQAPGQQVPFPNNDDQGRTPVIQDEQRANQRYAETEIERLK